MSRYMRAYYFTFTPTGNDAVDAILEAIATAGKAYHNTSEWGEPAQYGAKEGPSYWDAIQEAANKAALAGGGEAAPMVEGWLIFATYESGIVKRAVWLEKEDAEEDAKGWRMNGATTKIVPLTLLSAGGSSAAQEWIPCSERLPEKYGLHYLVAHQNGKVSDGEWIHSHITGKGSWSWAYVTHWMPLPAAPIASYVFESEKK